MEWIEIKSNLDIERLQKVYDDFADSYLVSFSFQSGNYVDSERVSFEMNYNNLYLKFQRLDNNPFAIELLFEKTRRINCLFPVDGIDNYTSSIQYAKVVHNDDFFYWTVWEEFNPYNNEHLLYNDFTLIEAKNIKWRIVE